MIILIIVLFVLWVIADSIKDYKIEHEIYELKRELRQKGGETMFEKDETCGLTATMGERMEYALECIISYNGHNGWLEELADEIEKAPDIYKCPFDYREWHTEEHTIWMILVGMFGNWGTSIRGGWIEEKQECADYIRKLITEETEEGLDESKI